MGIINEKRTTRPVSEFFRAGFGERSTDGDQHEAEDNEREEDGLVPSLPCHVERCTPLSI